MSAPRIERRRYWWGKAIGLTNGNTTTFDVPAVEVLPSNWQQRRWALAEVRGYRSGSTAIVQPALIQEIRAKQGGKLLVAGVTGDGFGVDPQSGPQPLWIPLPGQWEGDLQVDATSDSGAGLSFRFHFSFVELTEEEWLLCGGIGGVCNSKC